MTDWVYSDGKCRYTIHNCGMKLNRSPRFHHLADSLELAQCCWDGLHNIITPIICCTPSRENEPALPYRRLGFGCVRTTGI